MRASIFKPGEETWDGEYVICPHCGETMGDCWEWVTEREESAECSYCEKPIIVWAEHSVDYHAIADTRPQGGDAKQAPFTSGGGAESNRPNSPFGDPQ